MDLHVGPCDERWMAFVASEPQANVYHHPAWLRAIAECYGYRPFVITLRDASGRIAAGLPMMEVNSSWTGRRWVSLPFTDHCAPLCSHAQAVDELIDGSLALARDARIPRIELRWAPSIRPDTGRDPPYVLHTAELEPDSKLVADRVHPMHRRNVEVGRKRGVRIEYGQTRECLEQFCRLHLAARRRQGLPIQPRRFFDLLAQLVFGAGLAFVLTAYKDGQCLAAAVFLHWQQTLTYKYGASSERGLSLRPNNVLFWTAIEWGCEHGYTVFDMGRTDFENTGLREFKSRWGAREQPLVYTTLPAAPSPAADSRRFSLVKTVIRHSPAWVCRLTGELMYRHFG